MFRFTDNVLVLTVSSAGKLDEAVMKDYLKSFMTSFGLKFQFLFKRILSHFLK